MKPEFGLRCDTCPCFERVVDKVKGPTLYGECRLSPPQVLMVQSQIMGANQPPKAVYAWPIMQEDQHCWQYVQVKSMENGLRHMIAQQEQENLTENKVN